ncbi:BLOC-1 complex, subunit 3 [Cinara cedri]|uniref:Biogenesis of lysosome-related organelles complex 1 subunit 3 n=1 Tax=Cinara cedri TaxID=506608 RepID=A0A5E4N0V3_9HEMI|nr:BLOC-1 complex, subunit 3 [Cinara cedri]
MSDKAMLVLGEAPESDDEELQQENYNNDGNNSKSSKSGIAENEQVEFDSDSNNHTRRKSRTVKESFAGRTDNYKMSEDTLLHRKLKEKNIHFYSNLTSFNKQMYINAMNQMNETNQQLVKAQVLLQDTVTNWKYIEQNLSHIKRKMTDILSEEYIPKIKI